MLKAIEPAMARSLVAMEGMSDIELESLELDGSVLPGNEGYKLTEESFKLRKSSLMIFKEAIEKAHLYDGVIHQIREFTTGLIQVIPRKILAIVGPQDMGYILGGSSIHNNDWWRTDAILAAVRADHGYTLQSKQVLQFAQILSELLPEERLLLVRFVTGSRTLPVGGFAGLKPPLTIVKAVKNAEEGHPDDFLPSVMTCANFVKVPEYSTIEIMREKLLTAIREGQNSFLLS